MLSDLQKLKEDILNGLHEIVSQIRKHISEQKYKV